MSDFSIQVRVTGLEELKANLKRMPIKMVKQVLRPAVRAAAKPITVEARRKIDQQGLIRTGALRRSIGVKVKTFRNRAVWAGVGPRRGFNVQYRGKNVDPRRYSHLLEKGTISQKATPFLRPATDNTRGEQFSEFVKKGRTFVAKLS
jgi:HK97 gp10 family phage protein